MPLTRQVDEFLSEKRAHKQAKRRLKLWREELEKRANREQHHAAFGDRSRIIKMIANGSDKDPATPKGGLRISVPNQLPKSKLDFSVPNRFSIIEAPEIALDTVCSFARAIRRSRVQSVRISHRDMVAYDLAPNGLFDVVAVELKAEAAQTSRRIRWAGQFPNVSRERAGSPRYR